LSAETRASAPDLPWKDVAGFRDFLIHGYDKVIPERIWDVIEGKLQAFLDGIQQLGR
jgi:uncharacterized protein with HEPN domain